MASERALPERHRGPAAVGVLGACAVIAFLALLISGVTVGEVLLFAGFEIAFALVPGVLLFLALFGRPRRLIDTLAVAWPLGLAIEIGCFVLAAAVGARWLFTLYPAVFVLLAAPVLWRRRGGVATWPARLRRPVALEVAIAVVLVTIGAAFVVYLVLFAASPLPRDTGSVSYYPDLIFNISLAAELLHHWPFMDPSVAGVPLHYEIFANVDMAATAQITRLDLATIAMRLQPTLLIGLLAAQLFALGRRVGRSGAAGLIALTLGLFAGELNFSRRILAGGGASALGSLYSPSYQLGAVFFLAILMVLVDHLSLATDRSRAYPWPALALLTLGALGAKATVVPVVAGGLVLFALGRAALRRGVNLPAIRGDDIRSLAVIIAAGTFEYVVLYRGGGQGVRLKPLDFVPSPSLLDPLSRAGAAVPVLFMLLLPLGGIFLVTDRWWSRARSSSAERLLLCMLVASLPPFVLIGVPGDSEAYFVAYGFLAASVVSAAGIAAVAERLRLRAADLIRPALVCAAGVSAVIVVLWKQRSGTALVPAYAFLACLVLLATWMLLRRLGVASRAPKRRALALAVSVVIGLTVVAESFQRTAPTLERWIHGATAYVPSGTDTNRGMTADLWRGLLWLRAHSRPSDVLAVNNHFLEVQGVSRYYYYSAFSERRVVMEAWDYTPQGYEELALGKGDPPFPALLALNDGAVNDANPAAISRLHDGYGVRYIVIDRLHGPVAPALPPPAHVAYSNPAVTVFRVG